ncbi:MAG: M20/M25/M40 family metallo-hydrolase [Pseudomonadales bacterium]|nr:M20/M25/M40 family metallo-hydrolase [Pseudomonadales bacterium]
MNKLSFVVLVLMLFLTISIKADLTNIESRIAAIAEAEKEVAIQLLETVVNINSGTMNHPGVKKVADVFEKEFLALGMKTSWFDMKEVNRSGHLFAETRLAGDSSAKGKCILLVGHLDTVFEEDSDFQVFKRKGDLAHGPGVNDMKGGDVVIIQALKALQAVDELQNKKIIVALMGDEEKSGSPNPFPEVI